MTTRRSRDQQRLHLQPSVADYGAMDDWKELYRPERLARDAKRLPESEKRLRRHAPDELEAWSVAHDATSMLMTTLAGCAIPRASTVAGRRRAAVMKVSGVALRTARACMLVIAHGYVVEAAALKRRVSEAEFRLRGFMADKSGAQIDQWLNGRPAKPGKLAAKHGSLANWEAYSGGAHVNADKLYRALLLENGAQAYALEASREPEMANYMLTELAIEARNICVFVLSVVRDIPYSDELMASFTNLDERIETQKVKWMPQETVEWMTGDDDLDSSDQPGRETSPEDNPDAP